MHRAARRFAAVLSILVTACAPRSDHGETIRSAGTGAAACEMREVDRRILEGDDGQHLYVEPSTIGATEGGFMVAGHPTYSWTVDSSGRGTQASARSFFGVEVRDDEVALVPNPPGLGHVGDARSVLLESGAHAFLIEEVDRPEVASQTLLRVVYAEHQDGRWTRVEEVPAPPDGWLTFSAGGAPLASGGDRLEWSTVHRRADGRLDVLHYVRDPSGWRFSVAVPDWVDAVALGADENGRLIGLGGLDPAFDGRLASVRLHRLEGSWSPGRRVYPGRIGERFYAAAFVSVGRSVDLVWLRVGPDGSDAWVVTGAGAANEGAPRRLDPGALLFTTTGSGIGSAYVLTLHVDPGLGIQQLRVYRREAPGYRLVTSMPYPFQGPFAAVETSSGGLTIIGPEAVPHPVTPFVRSLVIRLSPCT